MVILVNQQINGVLRTIPGKFELHSWSVLGRMVNQQINRNMRALPNFSSDCFSFQSTYQQGIAHALGKIWVLFSVNVGQNGESTDQQTFACYTLIFGFLISDTQTGQSTYQRDSACYTLLFLCLKLFLFNISTGIWRTHWENLSFNSWAGCSGW